MPIEPPVGTRSGWPLVSSIRRLDVSASGISAWIGKSIGGGICVLAGSDQPTNGIYGVAVSCSDNSEALPRGATVELSELPSAPDKTYTVGVAPAGVSSVESTLSDGTRQTVRVVDNAWAMESGSPPREYSFSNGQTITVGE